MFWYLGGGTSTTSLTHMTVLLFFCVFFFFHEFPPPFFKRGKLIAYYIPDKNVHELLLLILTMKLVMKPL